MKMENIEKRCHKGKCVVTTTKTPFLPCFSHAFEASPIHIYKAMNYITSFVFQLKNLLFLRVLSRRKKASPIDNLLIEHERFLSEFFSFWNFLWHYFLYHCISDALGR
jgi:hypothetical protein